MVQPADNRKPAVKRVLPVRHIEGSLALQRPRLPIPIRHRELIQIRQQRKRTAIYRPRHRHEGLLNSRPFYLNTAAPARSFVVSLARVERVAFSILTDEAAGRASGESPCPRRRRTGRYS